MANLAIIPARGGSKRIPRKNIKPFLGKPIIAYSIEAAIKSNLFNEVMVSTDDDEIAKIAKQYGAKVPFLRSKKNSDDFASTFDVINEVHDMYKNNGIVFEITCCLYPTAPFITPEKLIQGFNFLDKENEVFGSFSAIQYSYPIQRSFKLDKYGFVDFNYKEHMKSRSQDLESNYHDIGQFYFYYTEEYIKKKSVFNLKTKPVVLSELEAQDIDNKTDWKLAELKYALLNRFNG